MSEGVLRVAWYRFGATFGRRRGGYLTLILLVALIGGLAMGSIAAARRTQSSFPVYLASTNPSDVGAATGLYSRSIESAVGYSPSIVRAVSHLPYVRRVESYAGFARNLLIEKKGYLVSLPNSITAIGSVDGEFFNQDRVTVVAGHMADPRRADEEVISAAAAKQYHVHVGDVGTSDFYTNAETYLPGFGTPSVHPYLRMKFKVVGIVVFSNEVVEDDIDALSSQFVLFTPALTKQLTRCCTTYSFSSLQVVGGTRNVDRVESELARVVPGVTSQLQITSVLVGKAERAIKPESIALGVFGGIVALAALLIAAQLIGRLTRANAEDLGVLRALGADPAMTESDGLIGILGAVVIGSILALVLAVALSPLAPIGPVRPIYPTPGIAFDWTVLGLGAAALIVGLSALAVVLSQRQAPHRMAHGLRRPGQRRSSLARRASNAGMPAPAVAGIRFALEPGSGKNAVPVRSAILGAALAVVVVITTVTFGSSLTTLVSHPALYGWNWNDAISADLGDMPAHKAATLLDDDQDVAAWSGVYFSTLDIDGRVVDVLGVTPNTPVQPPILSGHGLEESNQVVLGAITLAELHKHVGQTVTVSGSVRPRRLTIVGTATMPTTGTGSTSHLEMGTGALLEYQLISGRDRNFFDDPVAGPNAIFVRFKSGADPTTARQSLQAIATELPDSPHFETVQRPAEIVNFRSMGRTPALLGAALAVGAVVALGLTLIASVRRRRRELALLKTLGFTARQLSAAVAWQSSIAVAIGTIVGVPIGIALGRFLWVVFAREINAVPDPTVPVLTVVLIALGALLLANLVAALPGRIAARTPTAILLRAE